MGIPLAEALAQVELEVGRTYRCEVKGRVVELRVLPIPPELRPAPLVEDDIMLDPWVELPGPESSAGNVVLSRLDKPDPPDIPDIPQEEEGP